MKIFKYLSAAVVTIALLSSCSVVKSVATNALTSGTNTGSALSTLYKVLNTTGSIDLSNVTNIINLGKILTGAGSVSNANSSFLEKFTSGLISGSSGLVTNSNASAVINGLKALSNIDTSAITKAAASAAAGSVTQLTSSTPGVSATLSQLNSIFSLMK
ncbi:MAG: hypothetical protein K5849_05590 [Bacteroidales bacterium]|nr:hypothetical protein [Bacteroidales bacterium]